MEVIQEEAVLKLCTSDNLAKLCAVCFVVKGFWRFISSKIKTDDAFFTSIAASSIIVKVSFFLLLPCYCRNNGWSVGITAAWTDSASKGPGSQDSEPCWGPEEQPDVCHPTGSHPEEGEMFYKNVRSWKKTALKTHRLVDVGCFNQSAVC